MSPEVITTAAGAAGYIAGQAAEIIARQRAASNREAIAEVWGSDFATEQAAAHTRGLGFKRVVATMVTPIALAAGAGAALETYAWLPGEAQEQAPAPLIIVADHSGGVNFGSEGATPIETINSLITNVGTEYPNSQILVASSGQVLPKALEEVQANVPFGGPLMGEATNLALGIAAETTAAQTTVDAGSTNVLVVTNGNDIGNPEAVIAAANAVGTSVYVANVKGDQTPPETTDRLTAITEQTGGAYIVDTVDNTQEIIGAVNENLQPAEVEVPIPNRTMLKVIGGVTLLAAAGVFMRRRDMTLQRVKGA